MKPVLNIIGMGMGVKDLTETHHRIIRNADLLVGARRHLACFPELTSEKRIISKDMAGLIADIKKRMKKEKVVVLATGDPLFFGIGKRLIESLGKDHVLCRPNITSVAAAFSRAGLSWTDARVISLHGRGDLNDVLPAVKRHETVAILTDPSHTPDRLAGFLSEHGAEGLLMGVFEQLGAPGERYGWYRVCDAAIRKFSEPNLVIVRSDAPWRQDANRLYLGMADDRFEHEKGMITKAEVRSVTLARLKLMPHHVMWDLGAGSGSVSIEASLMIRTGRIFAVEKNPVRVRQIENNRTHFGVHNLTIIESEAPKGLDALPPPDRIFIGGGGKQLENIIRTACEYMKPEGLMVVNTILMDSLATVRKVFSEMGFQTDTIQVQINKSTEISGGQRFSALNPVWIVQAKREKKQ